MEPIQSIEHLKLLVASVRNRRNGFVTNFYLDEFKHQVWMDNGDFYFEQIGDTLFLIRQSNGFCNLFYCSTTIEELEHSFMQIESKYPELVKIVDVVGVEAQSHLVVDLLKRNRYTLYTKLVRMSRITPEENHLVSDGRISYASEKDAKTIRSLLLRYFDERCEQIPYQEELNEYANQNKILTYKENEEILGFVIFESNRSTHYLRYWFVSPDYRDKRIGSRLLKTFFHEGSHTRRQLLWVVTDNENAIKRYRHYGFGEENLYDVVMSNILN